MRFGLAVLLLGTLVPNSSFSANPNFGNVEALRICLDTREYTTSLWSLAVFPKNTAKFNREAAAEIVNSYGTHYDFFSVIASDDVLSKAPTVDELENWSELVLGCISEGSCDSDGRLVRLLEINSMLSVACKNSYWSE